MLVAFDQYGTLIRQLTHGTPARQGVVSTFDVVCFFKDKPFNSNNCVEMTLIRPNGFVDTVSHVMDFEENYTFHRSNNDDVNTSPFIEGQRYNVFKYSARAGDFNDFGNYSAVIKVYNNIQKTQLLFTGGAIVIPVQRSINDGTTAITQNQYLSLLNLITSVIEQKGEGDVVGPVSATDGSIAVFDGTTGKRIAASNLEIDYDDINRIISLSADGIPLNISSPEVVITSNNTEYVFGNKDVSTQKEVAVKEDFGASASGTSTIEINYIKINGVEYKIAGGGGGGSSNNQRITVDGTSFGANDVIDLLDSGIVTITPDTTNKTITFSVPDNYVPKSSEANRIYGTDANGTQTAYQKSDLIKISVSEYTLEEES